MTPMRYYPGIIQEPAAWTALQSHLDTTNLKWLQERTIFLTRHGSHAYGTNIAGSDEDFKGFAVPPSQYFHGFSQRFEQAEFTKPDIVIYDIRKFFRLAADCNPTIIEVLFTAPEDHIRVSYVMEDIMANRMHFLSRRVRYTFAGYARAQLKKIQTHRRWILNPPDREPNREDFGLGPRPEIPRSQLDPVWAQVRKQVEAWEVDLSELQDSRALELRARITDSLAQQQILADNRWQAAARSLGAGENLIAVMDGEKRFERAVEEWRSYQTFLKTRNPTRLATEIAFGYDTKHAMHLVRLLRMASEILAGQGVIVRRPDREELLAIRNGAWSYEDLLAWADSQEKGLEALYQTSRLPHSPPMHILDALCYNTVESFL